MLWRYRLAVGETGEARLGRVTTLVCVAYFIVWTVLGMAAEPRQNPRLLDHLARPQLHRLRDR